MKTDVKLFTRQEVEREMKRFMKETENKTRNFLIDYNKTVKVGVAEISSKCKMQKALIMKDHDLHNSRCETRLFKCKNRTACFIFHAVNFI